MIDEPSRRLWIAVAATVVLALILHLHGSGGALAVLFVIGLAMGVTLYHAALGFTGAYRRFTYRRVPCWLQSSAA